MSAAFSAIIIVGAFVLPEVMFGMIDASITLKFSIPLTLRLLSTTESSPLPILQVPTGWKIVWVCSLPAFTNSSSSVICVPGLYSSG